MDNQQTTKQIPKLEDAERLKELFEYEMTQVRTDFRKELLDLNAEKMNNAGKDISVPEHKEIETPVCQINEIAVEYSNPDIKTAVTNVLPDDEKAYTPDPAVLQMPDIPQTDHLDETIEAVSVPGKTEVALPAAVELEAVRQAGTYRSQEVSGTTAEAQEKIGRALSVLNDKPAQNALPEIEVASAAPITLADTSMDQLHDWKAVQTGVPAPSELNVPELKAQTPEMPALKPELTETFVLPDTGMPQTAAWTSAAIAVREIRPDQPLPELHAQAELDSILPEIALPEGSGVLMPEIAVANAFQRSAETAEYCVPEQSEVALPQMPQLRAEETAKSAEHRVPDQSEVQLSQIPAIGSVALPDMQTETAQIPVPQTDLHQIREWTPAIPATKEVPEQVKQAGSIPTPQMPLPAAVTVTNEVQLTLPETPSASGLAVSAEPADAEKMKAAFPVLPDIPNADIAGSAVSEIGMPQKAEFDQIQSGLQNALNDAAITRTAGNELLAEFQQAANS